MKRFSTEPQVTLAYQRVLAASLTGLRQTELASATCSVDARQPVISRRALILVEQLQPGLHVLRAPNPSPMTGAGTNTYILGKERFVVIDPGPDDSAHMRRLLDFIRSRGVLDSILITHSHSDHSALAPALAQATGVCVMAYGDSRAGRSDVMARLASLGHIGGGEGIDTAFRPDRTLQDNDWVDLEGERIRAIWTPGHCGNHLSFGWRDLIFSGDHVMGWTTTLISPPDGDVGTYMRSLDRLEAETPRRLYPGHGAPVDAPLARIDALRHHRRAREAAILSVLRTAPQTIPQLVATIYAETPVELHLAASRNVFAHLVDLHDRKEVSAAPDLRLDAVFALHA